jgi:dTDP-glucose 4,6-dehydratase
MRFLVTGTSGFIGTSFCERFASLPGKDIVGIDRRPPRETFNGVRYSSVELRNDDAVSRLVRHEEPEVIVHFAAQARVDPSLTSSVTTYRDNVEATINLIAAAESLGNRLERFIYASSETVYGNASSYPTKEASPLNPSSPYAASKAACELLVTRALGDRALVLRSGMGYGPRSDPTAQVVGKFVTRALRNQPLLFPRSVPRDRHPTRDVNFVTNFLDGLDLAIKAGASGTFNVASGQEVSILTLAECVVDLVGQGSVEFADEFSYRAGEPGQRTWLDISKAEETFAYRPKMLLPEGLRTSIDWYRSHPDYFGNRGPDSVVVRSQ